MTVPTIDDDTLVRGASTLTLALLASDDYKLLGRPAAVVIRDTTVARVSFADGCRATVREGAGTVEFAVEVDTDVAFAISVNADPPSGFGKTNR